MRGWRLTIPLIPLLPLLRFPSWSITGGLCRSCAALAGLLPFRRIGDSMVVVVISRSVDSAVGLSAPCLKGFLRRIGWNQAIASIAD
jgi:hypothetical protein